MILIFKAVKSAKYAALFTTKINFMCNVVCHNVFQIGVPKDSIAFKRAVNLGINITGELHGHSSRLELYSKTVLIRLFYRKLALLLPPFSVKL